MNTRLISRLAVFILVMLVVVSIITASAAANTVPTSHLTDQTTAITADTLKPAQCNGLTLTGGIYICIKNNCTASGPNMLVLGTSQANKIDGVSGSCCVGINNKTTYSNCAWGR
jgi:hypothetical protein